MAVENCCGAYLVVNSGWGGVGYEENRDDPVGGMGSNGEDK